jgi:hypothetical protein
MSDTPKSPTEKFVPCTCPQCRGRMVARGVPMMHAIRDVMQRQIAEVKEDMKKEIRRLKKELLRECRAEIRRSMNADDNVINFKELRRG